MHVAAAMFTPASLMAAATRASAPGVFSMSMTRSIAIVAAGASLTRDGDRGGLAVFEQRRDQDDDVVVAEVCGEMLHAGLLHEPLAAADLRAVAGADAAQQFGMLVGRPVVNGNAARLHGVRERAFLDVCGLSAGVDVECEPRLRRNRYTRQAECLPAGAARVDDLRQRDPLCRRCGCFLSGGGSSDRESQDADERESNARHLPTLSAQASSACPERRAARGTSLRPHAAPIGL